MAKPTSALFNAGESLTPSPVIPTTRFISWQSLTILDLSVGSALAITLIFGMIFFTSSSLISLSCAEDNALSLAFCRSPASFAMATAVSSLSPVIITTWMPAPWTSRIASRASGRTSSRIPTRPMITTSSLMLFSTILLSEYPKASTRMALPASSSIFLSRTALSIFWILPSWSMYNFAFARSLSGAPL